MKTKTKRILGLPDYQALLEELRVMGLNSERDRLQVRLTASARDRVVAIILDHLQAGGENVSEWVKEAVLMRIGLLDNLLSTVEEEKDEAPVEVEPELSRDVIQNVLQSFTTGGM